MDKLTIAIISRQPDFKQYEKLHQLFSTPIIGIVDQKSGKKSQLKYLRLYYRKLCNDFAAQRNFALNKIHTPWTFFADSDEEVSKPLAKEVIQKIENSVCDGYLIKRTDVWMGKKLKYGEFGNTWLLRLGKTKKGNWVRSVHEEWKIVGTTGKFKEELEHFPHPTVTAFINNISKYAILHSNENQIEGKKVSFSKIIIFPVGKFFYFYIVKQGYKDGIHGFVAGMIMSFHSFLSWSQLWCQKNYSLKSK